MNLIEIRGRDVRWRRARLAGYLEELVPHSDRFDLERVGVQVTLESTPKSEGGSIHVTFTESGNGGSTCIEADASSRARTIKVTRRGEVETHAFSEQLLKQIIRKEIIARHL